MKKIWGWIVGVVLVVAIGAYIIWGNVNAMPMTAATDANPDNGGSTSSTNNMPAGMVMTSTSSGTVTGGNGNTGGTVAAGYKDGAYTGPVENAVYGNLQLVVTISGGKITDVTWPVYPNSPGHTSDVSASALPQLEQEAIAVQSASVNVVSGATQDSQAFQQSLAAALAEAKS